MVTKAAVIRFEGKPNELVLIEIQSTALMEDGSALMGNLLGDLEIKGGAVTLTNGPRCLYGKMENLKSPLVLMERTGQEESFQGDESKKNAVLAARGVVRRKAVFKDRPQLSVESFNKS
ncbi:unnamed protein product [Polarella glacialis]|uniref:Uncharacterized protein n=1 Tax=Polarella glacialis TaxID=89957 RepID=A0A813LYT5_POLGL|nr:unnamed protein product [Polarella glacialis]CAE8641647.1 unnamed protein product [Polarella glacialis]CAE8741706.1 unnamed protein product [Polarella glacialis]